MKNIFSKKKHLIFLVVLISFCALTFGSYHLFKGGGNLLKEYSKGLTWYEIDGVFSPREKKIHCQQRINYLNVESTHLTDIYFHLYPNSFSFEDRPVFPQEEMDRAYPNGFSAGCIDIKKVHIGGASTPYTIDGYRNDILKIPLDEPLKPGERMDIWLEYSIKLPNSPGRFGYFENTYNLGNWYPILCVYDERGWHLEPYYPIGDPFYSDVANYRVSIRAPEEFTIASTGDLMNIKKEEGQSVWEFEALGVRDFAWVGSEKFKISSMNVGDTMVHSYYYTQEGGEKALDFGVHALKIFNELFGVYPYKNLSIVQTDFFIGGMEYPGLVMVDGNLYKGNQDNWLEVVTVHEVAHQWWYGLVGNDQVHDSWLDEALTEYSTIIYYGFRYGQKEEKQKYEDLINKGKYQLFKIYRADQDIDETIHRPLYEFDDWIEYDSLVYGKGAIMFYELRKEMGDETFFKVLNKYFLHNRFKNAKPEDLFKICQEVTGQSWLDFFEQWLYDSSAA